MTKRRMTRGLILLGSAVALAADPIWMAAQQQTNPAPMPGAGASLASTQPAMAPAPSMPGMVPATQNAFTPAPTKPRTTQPTTQISMRFKDAPIDAVLQHLSQAAGFEVVKDGALDGRVTVWADQPVSPEEAVRLLNTLLKPNGYTAIQMDKILKITSRDKAKKGSIPVHYGAVPEDIPNTDELITQVIPVKTVDAVKLKADLIPLVGTDADLTANGGSNSIIMTDTSANIRRVAQIISQLDKRDSTDNDIIVQQLKYADAEATAKLILDIFKPTDTANPQQNNNPFAFFGRGGGQGGGRGGFGGGGFGGPGGGGGQGGQSADAGSTSGHTGTVTASSDTRTNTIVVTGPKDTLAVIRTEILSKIDANPSVDQTVFTYHVKNGQAIDMQTTLNAFFGVTISGSTNRNSSSGSRTSSTSSRASSGFGNSSGSSSRGGSSGSSGFGSSSSSNSSRTGTSSSNSQSRNGNNIGGFGSGSGGGSGSSSSGLAGAAADLIGQVEVVADSDTNSLLVLTASKYEAQVRQIIADLDRPVPQVLIKVLIAEVTHDRSDDLGVDFSILNLSRGLSGGSSVGNSVAAAASPGGLAVTLVERQLATTFHALAVAGKLDVLSRPYILTSDNQEANILVGQNVPFITDSRVTDTGQTINTIQYQDIGIILDVTPHINTDGLVIMDVAPQISSQSDQSVTIQPGVNAPVFNTRSASSHVAVRDGDTIVIGGLMQDQKNQTITKVPILGDIPYLGLLFQRDQVTKTKTELLIFLTPHVALTPIALQPMSVDEMKGVHLTPGAVQNGMFQEHVKGLQLGGSATQPSLPVPKPEYDRDHWEPEPKMP